jgi:uncharacterized protein YjbI with pentapeptide repeats
MANEEHLRIIQQGVKVWNQWRVDNPDIESDLSEADLSGADLSEVNLSGADLSKTNLVGANLIMANLSEATLAGADLSQANLRGVFLFRAYLQKANLTEANLSRARLARANLYEANLFRANLSEADISEVNLNYTNLSEADLSEAILIKASLKETDLSRANLSGANLSQAIIREAIFRGAQFTGANLEEQALSGIDLSQAILTNVFLKAARLINTNLDQANLTGARLWETQRAGWSIKGVICEYVYWDKDAKEKTAFAPGEFERLYADQTKIKLFYKDGITPLEIATLPALIQHLEDAKDYSLRFVSINEGAGGAVVELAIENIDNQFPEQVKKLQESLTAEAQKLVEVQQQVLTERDERKELEGQLKELRYWFEKKLLLPTIQYNNTGQVGAMGENPVAPNNTLNQIVNAENSSVGTQVQGERNLAIDGDASDSKVSTGDNTNE